MRNTLCSYCENKYLYIIYVRIARAAQALFILLVISLVFPMNVFTSASLHKWLSFINGYERRSVYEIIIFIDFVKSGSFIIFWL